MEGQIKTVLCVFELMPPSLTSLQEDRRFLRELFSQLQDENVPEERFKELVSLPPTLPLSAAMPVPPPQAHLLREVCNFSLALEVEDRAKCYKKLSSYGFMSAVEGMLVWHASPVRYVYMYTCSSYIITTRTCACV